MVFPAVMYVYESWTTKKAECPRNDALELWCCRRLLRVPWIARRSNQSILKEIGPEYSLEGLMLKLKHQYLASWCKELTHWKGPWCWERLKVGREGDNRRWDGWMASPTQWTWVWVNSGSCWWTERLCVLQSLGSQRVGHDEQLNWTEIKILIYEPMQSGKKRLPNFIPQVKDLEKYFINFPIPLPSGNHLFFSLYLWVCFCCVFLACLFLRFHKWVRSYDNSFSLSDLFT